MNEIFGLSSYSDLTSTINEPLNSTQRVKYTCFDASKNYLVFGATSGSLYIFNRKPCKFLYLVPNKNGPVNLVAISPNEKFIAFSTLKGSINVYVVTSSTFSAREANLTPQIITANTNSNSGGGILNASDGNDVPQLTCLHWSSDEKQFYYGDRKGQVNLVTLNFFMGRNLLNISVHPILFLDSTIVQISDFDALLLVSNYTKCIICNTEYEEYKQIGNRPRDGYYGCCFAVSPNDGLFNSRIYCSRPGSRIWEVDLEGNVLQTHQFKTALAIPPTPIINYNTEDNEHHISDSSYLITDYPPQTLQFSKLQTILNDFIVTFTEFGLYIFDPRISVVVLWTNAFERIADCKIVDDAIFIYTSTNSLFSVRLQTIQSISVDLVREQKYLKCVTLLKTNVKYFADKAKEEYDLVLLGNLKAFLIKTNQYELLNDLSVIFDSISNQHENDIISSSSGTIGTSRKLDTGIYVLENAFCDNLRIQKQTGTGNLQGMKSYKNKSNLLSTSSLSSSPSSASSLSLSSEKQFKDALLTVTGKFGRNIIKYKFNIFSEDQKSVVQELIPSSRKNIPLHQSIIRNGDNNQEGNEDNYSNEEDLINKDGNETDVIVIRNNKKFISNSKSKPSTVAIPERIITDEEKTIYNLYLIFKSSKISNCNFLDRYSLVFDEYTAKEIVDLLEKLEQVMLENSYTEIESKKNCYEIYFNYLKPELIWEVDNYSRDYIRNGFILLNKDNYVERCPDCNFPTNFQNICKYYEIGEILVKYYWSRNEQEICFKIVSDIPAILDVVCRHYIQENQARKVIPIVMQYGDVNLFKEAAKQIFQYSEWDRCIEIFTHLHNKGINCFNCNNTCTFNILQEKEDFYKWDNFLINALNYLRPKEILSLILKYSNLIANDAIGKEFFLQCLIK